MPTIQEAFERIWSDEALKNRLLSDPKPVLAEFGLDVPDSLSVQVHENTPQLINFVLPLESAFQGVDPEQVDPAGGKVFKTAWADPAFKAKLLADPKTAIQEATGTTFPAGTEVKVYENTPALEHLVLPVDPSYSELSDSDLEAVAGGMSKTNQWAVGCGAGTAVAGGLGAALAFTAVGAAIGFGAAAVVAGAASTGGSVAASESGK
jgi:phage terminase large subunit-like protein